MGDHDIIFARRFCNELGIVIDYKNKTMTWNDLSIPMSNKISSKTIYQVTDDRADADLPDFMKKATHRLTKGLSANQYGKHDYREMVNRCQHLNKEI